MKWNFGHGLFLGAATFVAFIFFLVSNMLQQDIDLVADDYYEEGLNYQQKIDEAKRSLVPNYFQHNTLGGRSIQLVPKGKLESKSCEVSFYRPSDSEMDFTGTFPVNVEGIKIEDTRLTSGFWHLSVSWDAPEGKQYSELEVMVP